MSVVKACFGVTEVKMVTRISDKQEFYFSQRMWSRGIICTLKKWRWRACFMKRTGEKCFSPAQYGIKMRYCNTVLYYCNYRHIAALTLGSFAVLMFCCMSSFIFVALLCVHFIPKCRFWKFGPIGTSAKNENEIRGNAVQNPKEWNRDITEQNYKVARLQLLRT